MITAYLSKRSLPTLAKRVVLSPTVAPAISYAIRDVVTPSVSRLKSAVPVNQPAAAALSPFDDLFFHIPSYMATDLIPLAKKLDMEDDFFRTHFFSPGYKILSDAANVKISVDLPGVKMEDINIEIKNDKLLKITGERKTIGEDGKHVSEMEFDKRFTIGKNLDQSKISATLTDGVLTITAPKLEPEPVGSEDEHVRKIDIKTE